MTIIKPLLAATALIALTACEQPTTGITVSPEGAARIQTLGVGAVAPEVSAQVAIQAFADFCGRFPANPNGTRRAVEAEGYVLLGTDGQLDLNMYSPADGRPLVATGNDGGAHVCMVMFAEGPSLDRAVRAYVRQRHGEAAQYVGEMTTETGTGENVWIAPGSGSKPIVYFSLAQNAPIIGRLDSIAMATE